MGENGKTSPSRLSSGRGWFFSNVDVMLFAIMNRTTQIKWLKAITFTGIYGGLLIPLIFLPIVIFPFVFSKLLFFQLLIGLTFPAYLLLAWMEPKYRPRILPLSVAIAIYFVALGCSTIFSVDPLRSWWGNQERMNGLFTLLHFFAWYLMTVSLVTTWAEWKKILTFEIILSVVGGCVSLLQLPFPRLLSFPVGDRVGGLLDNPIYMAAYQIFNLFFIAWIWMKGVSTNTKWLLAGAAMIDLAAFLAAQSRGALLGLAVGLVVFAVVYGALTSNVKARRWVFALLGLAVLSYGLLFAFRNTDFVKASHLQRFTDFNATTRTRFIAWEIAWQGFRERPVFGWGFDTFHILFNKKYNPESLEHGYYETWFDRSHNTVLDALSMTGAFGLLAYFGIFGVLYFLLFRAHRRGMIDVPTASVLAALPAAYFVQNLFVFDQPAGFTMSFFLFAIVTTLTAPPRKDTMPKLREFSVGAFTILQVAFLVIVWKFTVLPFYASKLSIESNNYFSAGRFAEAYDDALSASKISTPYLDEQTFLQARNLMELSDNGQLQKIPNWKAWRDLIVEITDKHLKDHPENTHPHFIYARFLDTMSRVLPEDAPKAEAEYKEAIRTSPKRQQLWFSYGRFLIQQNRAKDANDAFHTALDFDQNVGESWWFYGISLYGLKQANEGAQAVASSTRVSAPYQPQSLREVLAITEAFLTVHDREGLKKLWIVLPQFTSDRMALNLYLDLARIAEKMGENELRDPLVKWLSLVSKDVAYHLTPLQNGSVTSIDASLKLTPGNPPSTTATTTPKTIAPPSLAPRK